MTETTAEIKIECPHCGGLYFNYIRRRTTERVRLTQENGEIKMCGGGSPKDSVIIAQCRICGGEYDKHDIAEHLRKSGK